MDSEKNKRGGGPFLGYQRVAGDGRMGGQPGGKPKRNRGGLGVVSLWVYLTENSRRMQKKGKKKEGRAGDFKDQCGVRSSGAKRVESRRFFKGYVPRPISLNVASGYFKTKCKKRLEFHRGQNARIGGLETVADTLRKCNEEDSKTLGNQKEPWGLG